MDKTWSDLAALDPPAREAEMLRRYTAMAHAEAATRDAEMTPMARAEYSLTDEQLRAFTLSRMRTLLALPEEEAFAVMASYEAAMRTLPGGIAMRRVTLVQSLVPQFNADEEERLRKIAPAVFAGAPRRALVLDETPAVTLTAQAKKKPFWMFWAK